MTLTASGQWTPAAQRAYVVLIADLARAGLISLDELVQVAGSRPPHPDEWRCLADFLVPCGRISRFFYPSRTRGRDGRDKVTEFRRLRAAKLRELFSVGNGWPLSDRAVRNAEKHFDELFDEWQIQQPILSVESIEASAPVRVGSPPYRRVDRTTWTVSVGDSRLALVPICDELKRIVQRCCEIESLAGMDSPQLAYLLATLPDLPPELTLAAPTQRPGESILAGVDASTMPTFEAMIDAAAQAYRDACERPQEQVKERDLRRPDNMEVHDSSSGPASGT